jgi:hypothetical protein
MENSIRPIMQSSRVSPMMSDGIIADRLAGSVDVVGESDPAQAIQAAGDGRNHTKVEGSSPHNVSAAQATLTYRRLR